MYRSADVRIYTSLNEWVTTNKACRDGEYCLLSLFFLSVYSSTLCIEHSYGKLIHRLTVTCIYSKRKKMVDCRSRFTNSASHTLKITKVRKACSVPMNVVFLPQFLPHHMLWILPNIICRTWRYLYFFSFFLQISPK